MSLQIWGASVVVLLALLVGAALPALYQIAAAAREWRAFIRTRAAPAAQGAEEAFLDVRRAALSVEQVGSGLSIATALGAAAGPAVTAAMRAWKNGDGSGTDERTNKPNGG